MKLSLRCLLAGLVAISPLIAVAADTSTSTSTNTGTRTSLAHTRTVATNGFEVDIIYPRSNATYNLTESLPIVFAFQNISAAQSALQSHAGHFTFSWAIMPFGKVGEEQQPGGVYEDSWAWEINSTSPLPDTYILVNSTNVRMWTDGPWFPHGSIYQLQYGVSWHPDNAECSGEMSGDAGMQGMFFNINLGDPEPNLLDIPECPQPGGYIGLSTDSSSPCLAAELNTEAGDPCAVKVDQAMASSISSVAQYSATATSTSIAPAPSSTENTASIPNTPAQSIPAMIVVLACLKLAAV